jgi:hypothetical protein
LAAGKPHIVLDGFSKSEDFSSRSTSRSTLIPARPRTAHGRNLATQFELVMHQYSERRIDAQTPITEDIGIYVEITGFPRIPLPLDKLDNRDFKLFSCKTVEENVEIAIVFIPESRRGSFQIKVSQYLNPDLDSGKGFPRHHTLIDSIASIRLANIKSLWTDHPDLFPVLSSQVFWWEMWLKNRPGQDAVNIAETLAERIGGRLGSTTQSYYSTTVVLVQASVSQLEKSLDLISNLEELRKAKETPEVFIHSSPVEQQQWADDLISRIEVSGDINTTICILDSGVNYTHPILAMASGRTFAECWLPTWPAYDTFTQTGDFNDHGSKQAGLALLGRLEENLVSFSPIQVNHYIESARILPPNGNNDPALYGAITVGTAAKLEIERPNFQRVYSLAITATPEGISGQPSSWSSEIDLSTSGMNDGIQRLYIIAAGNNRDLDPSIDIWDQIAISEIEDPAQSWNAITVGSYTELTTNDDPTFDGWSLAVNAGDLCPSSRSSVNWGWRKQAPFKPDVVAEGGNRLISPNGSSITDADTVSLLTTSGRSTGQLFDTTRDSSSATAIVSYQAAVLMTQYPRYWPETIRGLLVHAAEWTPSMLARFGLILGSHSPKRAKELLLRFTGYGVTNLERALFSANHALTLITQDHIQPFLKGEKNTDPILNEMCLYRLPWPSSLLQNLPAELEVRLKVTLSYFIEPNPGRRGYRQRYSYQSHGLRFEVIRPSQSIENFRSYINGMAESDSYTGPEGDSDGWMLGRQLRTRGSIHSDIWTGSAADLADMHTIAVYPVGGWWKYRNSGDRWQNEVRYSLLVSLELPDETIDIYSEIETEISASVEV